MGVNIKAFRVILILLSSILSACVTAFAGPISFVGIAVPYLVKRGLHTSRPLVVIPGTFLGGAVFCMFCDLIARMAFCADRAEHQYRDVCIRCADRHIYDAAQKERKLKMESYYFQMDELSVGYNGKPLIEHINIGVKKGEIVTLIGPNGSGKSTILKSITRQLRLLGGRVSFDEQNIHQMSYREMSTKNGGWSSRNGCVRSCDLS